MAKISFAAEVTFNKIYSVATDKQGKLWDIATQGNTPLGSTWKIVRLSRVGSVGRDFLFILVKVSLVPRALPLLYISLVARRRPLSATVFIADGDKALVEIRNEEIGFS